MTQAAARQSRTPGGESAPVVACQNLTKVFKDLWMRDRARAVDDLTMIVRQHEVFGLLGPNGSGKSTTIKLMLGLLRPTRGRVAVFGKPPTDVATKRRVGYLPEESYLYPFLNARETLDYYGKLFELDSRTRTKRIDELLDMVGLSHAQFRPVSDYSKGMQRRIGLAQALINDPDLLILDEPTTGLDPIGTRQVKDLIVDLGRRGKTIILSSHLLADVEDVVDRMVILYGGKIRGEGTCDELLAVGTRTTIETDDLDEDTLAEIDRVIRERTGGEKSIRSVTVPRQKLEELFLTIVESARAEKAATSGVNESGHTAAFLKGEDEGGEALIDRLLQDDVEPMPEAAQVEGEPAGGPKITDHSGDMGNQGPDVIADLVADDDQPAESSEPRHPTPAHPAERAPAVDNTNVDDDVIGSLLDTQDDDDTRKGDDR